MIAEAPSSRRPLQLPVLLEKMTVSTPALQLVEGFTKWKQAWDCRPAGIKPDPRAESLPRPWSQCWDAINFTAGAAYRDGYRLFHNGGRPLLERRWQGWTAEILFKIGSHSVRGVYAPLTVVIHLSHAGIAEVRSRYINRNAGGLSSVASKNLGHVLSPGSYALFNLAHEGAQEKLADSVVRFGIPWVESYLEMGFDDDDYRSSFTASGKKLVSSGFWEDPDRIATTCEVLLASEGWGRAGRYLHGVLAKEAELATLVSRAVAELRRNPLAWDAPVCVEYRKVHRLALVSASYRLL